MASPGPVRWGERRAEKKGCKVRVQRRENWRLVVWVCVLGGGPGRGRVVGLWAVCWFLVGVAVVAVVVVGCWVVAVWLWVVRSIWQCGLQVWGGLVP